MRLGPCSGLLIDWLEMLDPEVVGSCPDLQQRLLFSRSKVGLTRPGSCSSRQFWQAPGQSLICRTGPQSAEPVASTCQIWSQRRDGRGAVGPCGPRSSQGAGGRVEACSPEEGRGRSPHQGPSGPGKMKKLTGRPGRGCVAPPRSCPVLAGLHFRGCGSPSCAHSAARVSPFLRGGFTSQR